MSVTVTSKPQPNDGTVSHRPAHRRALERFDELLFANPEICSHCFSRIRDEQTTDSDSWGSGRQPDSIMERAGKGALGQDVEFKNEYGSKRAYRARTYCAHCGSPGGAAIGTHDHSLQSAMDCVYNIARRLHEMGYYPDLQTLWGVVGSFKRDPDKQGRDRQLFATAVHMALERGGEAPGTSLNLRPETPPELRRAP